VKVLEPALPQRSGRPSSMREVSHDDGTVLSCSCRCRAPTADLAPRIGCGGFGLVHVALAVWARRTWARRVATLLTTVAMPSADAVSAPPCRAAI
jgi:hypothetical protein